MRRVLFLLLAAALLLPAHAGTDRELSDFSAASSAWKPGPDAPIPITSSREASKIGFVVPAGTKADRLYWDLETPLNAAAGDCLVLDLWCAAPAPLEKVLLHLKSGAGWLTAARGFRSAGWNRWILPLADFEAEGAPGPVTKAGLIRIALHPRTSAKCEIAPHSLRLVHPDVLVVTASSSARDAAQRSLARASSGYLMRWMEMTGIPFGVVDDDQVAAGALTGAKLALFGGNPEPGAKEVAAIRSFLKGGGKIAAWYPESGEWASLLQVRDVRMLSSKDAGHFASLVFKDSAFPRVQDPSWNVLTARPAAKSGQIAATWRSALGKSIDTPAVLQTPAGWWFSQPPRAGDPAGKTALLTRLAGSLSPKAWSEAAYTAIMCGPPSAAGAVPGLDPARKAFAGGKNEAAWRLAMDARLRHEKTFAATRPAVPGALHAVWDHNGTGLQAGGWDTTCAQLAQHGVNAIFSNVLWSGKAHCATKLLPASDTLQLYGDQLAQLLAAAKPRGIDVHVWKVCWQMAGADPAQLAALRKLGRLQQTADGREIPWLNPCLPENWRTEIDAMKDVVTRYPVAGIHLDYVRYPDRFSCYSPATRLRYEAFTGKKVKDWPAQVKPGGPLWTSYARFRANQITQFVRQASKELRAVRPGLQVSAAVWGKYPDCLDAVGQDWPAWLKEGLVDFVTPMNYTANPSDFEALLQEQLAFPGAAGKIVPGLGVTSNECELYPSEVLQQLVLARKNGCTGFSLFKLDPHLMQNVLPVIAPALKP